MQDVSSRCVGGVLTEKTPRGVLPTSMLVFRSSSLSLLRAPSAGGIGPAHENKTQRKTTRGGLRNITTPHRVIWMYSRYSSKCLRKNDLDNLPDSPCSSLELRSRRSKAPRSPSCGGMCPVDVQVKAKAMSMEVRENIDCFLIFGLRRPCRVHPVG